MKRALLALASLAAAGCLDIVEPGVRYPLRLVTETCDGASPLEGVTHLRFRLVGENLAPEERLLAVGDARPDHYVVPPGDGRMLEVVGFDADPASGGRAISAGRTARFTAPAEVTGGVQPPELALVLRRVDVFTSTCLVGTDRASRMRFARAGHTATLLADGRVYIAGGYQMSALARTASYKAEFYNPVTGDFEEAPDLGVPSGNGASFSVIPRAFHTATLLTNGQVLIWTGESYNKGDVNGSNSQPWASVVIYDPQQNTYGGVGTQFLNGLTRSHHSAARDATGRVIIVGGMARAVPPAPAGTIVADKVEWYDPATQVAKVVDGVSLPRRDMSVQAVQGGALVAVAGGSDGTALRDDVIFFRYDPGTRAVVQQVVASAPRLREKRRSAAAALGGTSDLMLIGGYTSPSAIEPVALAAACSGST